MAINLERKQQIVAEVSDIASRAMSAVVLDYRGVDVASMTAFRAKARAQGVCVRVVRNTLARRALEDSNYACLKAVLVGPMMMVFSFDEPGAAARLVRDFAKECEQVNVQAIGLDGQMLDGAQLKAVASLPTKDEAIAQLMAAMLAPVTQLARTIKEPVAQAVRATAAVRDQKS